jgi:hypothetical protein
VRVDPVEHFDTVTGPLGHLGARSTGIEPPRDPGMAEVVKVMCDGSAPLDVRRTLGLASGRAGGYQRGR